MHRTAFPQLLSGAHMMATGRDLELRVEQLLKHQLARRTLGLDPRLARVLLHPTYPSQVRGSSIKVDLAIEVYQRDASEPYLIWVWECKEYRDRVPVDDVEEFHSKLEQIGFHKAKGTIACVNGFEKGAVQAAKSWGIGLVRILPDGTVTRLVEESAEITLDFVESGLVGDHPERLTTIFYGLTTKGEPTTDRGQLVTLELTGRS